MLELINLFKNKNYLKLIHNEDIDQLVDYKLIQVIGYLKKIPKEIDLIFYFFEIWLKIVDNKKVILIHFN